jgi:hypothetical protein
MLPLVAAIAGTLYYAVVVAVWGPRIVKDGHVSAAALFIVVLFNLLVNCSNRIIFHAYPIINVQNSVNFRVILLFKIIVNGFYS